MTNVKPARILGHSGLLVFWELFISLEKRQPKPGVTADYPVRCGVITELGEWLVALGRT